MCSPGLALGLRGICYFGGSLHNLAHLHEKRVTFQTLLVNISTAAYKTCHNDIARLLDPTGPVRSMIGSVPLLGRSVLLRFNGRFQTNPSVLQGKIWRNEASGPRHSPEALSSQGVPVVKGSAEETP